MGLELVDIMCVCVGGGFRFFFLGVEECGIVYLIGLVNVGDEMDGIIERRWLFGRFIRVFVYLLVYRLFIYEYV